MPSLRSSWHSCATREPFHLDKFVQQLECIFNSLATMRCADANWRNYQLCIACAGEYNRSLGYSRYVPALDQAATAAPYLLQRA